MPQCLFRVNGLVRDMGRAKGEIAPGAMVEQFVHVGGRLDAPVGQAPGDVRELRPYNFGSSALPIPP